MNGMGLEFQSWGRRGVTLLEMMLSVSVLSVILGAVLVLQLQSLRMYQDVVARGQSSFQAATAIELMEDEIEGCFRVTGRYSDRITLTMPKTVYDTVTATNVPVQPLMAGDSVRYYLADATGDINRPGTHLWRAVMPAGGATYQTGRGPLAAGITQLQLAYTMCPAPRQDIVSQVNVVVTAQNRQQGTTRSQTHRATLVLRNAYYGPVTHENGTDPIEE